MSEPKRNCPKCKNEVEFVAQGSSQYCPVCWHTIEQSDTGEQSENRKEMPGWLGDLLAVVRVLVIFLLVLAGMFLVLLGFLYAACSHMGTI
jgi:uncharacterized Zn ribbon protein